MEPTPDAARLTALSHGGGPAGSARRPVGTDGRRKGEQARPAGSRSEHSTKKKGGPGKQAEPLKPIVHCVARRGPCAYTAYFGYENEDAQTIEVPIGLSNGFFPGPRDRGQPEEYLAGRTSPYPAAAFSVDFKGPIILWLLRGPDHRLRVAMASPASPRCPPSLPPSAACEVDVFGPKRYTRTKGEPDVYTDTVEVPPWLTGPFVMKVVNGDPDGHHRVSAASIEINGEEVAGPWHFGRKESGFEAGVVDLELTNTLEVRLASAPAPSSRSSSVGGGGTEPHPSSRSSHRLLRASSPIRPRTCSSATRTPLGRRARGIRHLTLSTLAVRIDGIDRTSLFTRDGGEARGTLPDDLSLGEGAHELEAEIADVAGNRARSTAFFTIDTLPPILEITSPAEGSYHRASPVQVTGTVRDLDPAVSVECRSGGTAVQAELDHGPFACPLPLAAGENTLEVVARDWVGHEARALLTVHLDTTPPVITVTSPDPGSYTAATTLDVNGTVEDASPVTITVGSVAAAVSGAAFTAPAVPIGDGPDLGLPIVAEDAAGNTAEMTLLLYVDREPPVVAISAPPDTWVRGPTVEVTGTVSDASPVTAEVNGAPADLSGAAPMTFVAEVSVTEGAFTLVARATDAAGNSGEDRRTISVDSTPPVISPPASTSVAAVDAGGTPVTDPAIAAFLTRATASDNVDGSLPVTAVSPPALFPLGTTVVTF